MKALSRYALPLFLCACSPSDPNDPPPSTAGYASESGSSTNASTSGPTPTSASRGDSGGSASSGGATLDPNPTTLDATGSGDGNDDAETTASSTPATASDTGEPGTTGFDPNDGMQIFLLFGQSNMEGVPTPAAEDLVENPRVMVLGYDASCNGRTWNEWSVARPPLHRCWAGVGPGDTFGKAMAEAWPEATIGLVPAAISGVDVDFFRKGVVSSRRGEFEIPPDNQWSSAYDMLVERARIAQESGTIRGILFHQGESDSGQAVWVDKVEEIVADLRADLGLGEDVPFIAGELLYSGLTSGHNTYVNQLPGRIPNAYVVSAEGLNGQDEYHFDLAGQRELGRRYAEAMLSALGVQ